MKKKKKSSGLAILFRFLLSLLLLMLTGLLLWQLYRLQIIPTVIFIPIFLVVLFIDLFLVFSMLRSKSKTGLKVTCSVLAIAISLVCGYGGYIINKSYSMLDRLTADASSVTLNRVAVLVEDNSNIDDLRDLRNKTVGIVQAGDTNGVQLCIDDIEAQQVSLNVDEYDSYEELATALVDGDVDAIIINEAYIPQITDLDGFQSFSLDTRSVYQYTYETANSIQSNQVANITTTPFTVFITGSDSKEGLTDADRSDVNMLVTVNPETHVVLMVGIPRDAYVPTICSSDFACQYGEYDKLTHSGMYSYDSTKRTIENFMDVDINYTYRVSFNAVVDLVDALGGIEVDVAPGYAVDYFYTNDYFGTDYGVTEGINHLNGEAALCYARERYAYLEGDFQRVRNQQEVLEQIIHKALTLNGLANYTNLLDIIGDNFWTDMSGDEIMALLRFQVSQNPDWSFISYFVNGESTSRYCAESYGVASVIVLDRASVGFAHDLIEDVLNGVSADSITSDIENYNLAADFTEEYPLPGESRSVSSGYSYEDEYSTYDYGYDYSGGYDYGYDSSYSGSDYSAGYSSGAGYDSTDVYEDPGDYTIEDEYTTTYPDLNTSAGTEGASNSLEDAYISLDNY